MERIHHNEYCLSCYAPLDTPSASQRCARCGRVHVRADQVAFWTREKRVVSIERTAKIGVVLFIVALFCVLVFAVNLGHERLRTFEIGPVVWFFVGPLLMLGGLLWWTCGFITRKPRYFSPKTLWSVVFVMLAFGPPLIFLALDIVARRQDFGSEYWMSLLVLTYPALPIPFLAVALYFLARKFEAFKKERIASGSW